LFPTKRLTINLAPADLPKDGSRLDLPIALGILIASGQLPENCTEGFEFIGELALDGHLRPVSGILPIAMACQQAQHRLLVPTNNLEEANQLRSLKFMLPSIYKMYVHTFWALLIYQHHPNMKI
jgi:magnesium chelatase family protein